MKCLATVRDLRTEISTLIKHGSRIALVPTMGNLHEGHLDLVTKARSIIPPCTVISTIFVNPLQFTSRNEQNNDFDKYPRTFKEDKEKLEKAGCHFLFAPESMTEIYPKYPVDTTVHVGPIGRILEGEFRPGFFEGVATVVTILLNLCTPAVLLLGEKDFQQVQILKQVIRNLHFNVEVVTVATRRETSGLAMSSRNNYLTDAEKLTGSSIYKVMTTIKQELESGNRNFAELEATGINTLKESGFTVEYLVIRKNDLSFPKTDELEQDFVILVAAFLNSTRLIDNLVVQISSKEKV